MGRTEKRETLIGAAALLVLAALFLLSYGTGAMASRAEVGFYSVSAKFNRIDGLAIGDSVRLGGIPVGTVGGVTLGDDYRAEVTFRIDAGVMLPTDTAAAIHTDGLFGSKFVVLEPGGDETPIKSGGRISYTQDSVIVSDLLDLIIAQGRERLNRDK